MSVFAQIDARLAQFTAAQHAVLTQNRNGESLRPWGPNGLGFEERRIDWQRDGFRLAVIIQPDFGGIEVNTSKWHFYALAWKNITNGKLVAEHRLVRGMPFSEIEGRVDELLDEARMYLNNLQLHDLRPRIFE